LDAIDMEIEIAEGPYAFDVTIGLVAAAIDPLEAGSELDGSGHEADSPAGTMRSGSF
jgi:hypothetical protein